MAKNKNPLTDLDAFLKQQASSLVSPDKVGVEAGEQQEKPQAIEQPTTAPIEKIEVEDIRTVLKNFTRLQSDYRPELYDSLIEVLREAKDFNANDTLLINTLLYLKNPEDWRKNIAEYWGN